MGGGGGTAFSCGFIFAKLVPMVTDLRLQLLVHKAQMKMWGFALLESPSTAPPFAAHSFALYRFSARLAVAITFTFSEGDVQTWLF